MGDPAGIGAEIVVAAAASASVRRACRLVVYGDAGLIERAWRLRFGRRARTVAADSAITCVQSVGTLPAAEGWPRPSRRCGEASFRYLEAATAAVSAGHQDALVTAPLNKLWMNRAGHAYDGHTGYLSEACGAPATMMLAGRRLRVVLVTTHIALADVARRLATDDIVRCGRTTAEHLRRFEGIERPRLAVAALNPHAGEDGLFGDEEGRLIAPAVARLRRARIDVTGPLPADTLFAAVRDGHYDAVLCMYHDQGLIPLKLLEFGRSVNVSMGLPVIRTSPDHGTAYDLAGKGTARADSMVESMLLAARMVRKRNAAGGGS